MQTMVREAIAACLNPTQVIVLGAEIDELPYGKSPK